MRPTALSRIFRRRLLLRFEHADQRFDLLRRRNARVLLRARLLNRLRDSFLVERLEQVIHGIHFKRLDRVLIESGGENDFRKWNLSCRAAS